MTQYICRKKINTLRIWNQSLDATATPCMHDSWIWIEVENPWLSGKPLFLMKNYHSQYLAFILWDHRVCGWWCWWPIQPCKNIWSSSRVPCDLKGNANTLINTSLWCYKRLTFKKKKTMKSKLFEKTSNFCNMIKHKNMGPLFYFMSKVKRETKLIRFLT